MRSPVSRSPLGECNAIKSCGFGRELTSGSALETEVDVSHKPVSGPRDEARKGSRITSALPTIRELRSQKLARR